MTERLGVCLVGLYGVSKGVDVENEEEVELVSESS